MPCKLSSKLIAIGPRRAPAGGGRRAIERAELAHRLTQSRRLSSNSLEKKQKTKK
jgi:hypothetical protein